jgi:hypothetical protein
MWKNIVERGMPQMTIWRMRIACRIHNATNTHSGCVILLYCNNGYSLEPQYYVRRSLPFLF